MVEQVAPRLPRGRHGLSRHEVTASQRTRMLFAIAEAMTEKGYVGTTVADVLRGAGVSRETFYQQFSSKLDCFLEAFDAAADLLLERMDAATEAEGTPIERFDRALALYLEALAAFPAFARLFLVETWAAGPEAIARRSSVQQRIVGGLTRVLDVDDEVGHMACELLVAGTGTLVTRPLIEGEPDGVLALHEPILAVVRRALLQDGDAEGR